MRDRAFSLPPALYIHAPFCRRKCHYCDFASVPLEADLVKRYLSALKREAERELASWPAGWEVPSIYIGGGTPTALEPEDLEAVLAVAALFPRAAGAEWTVEANPGTLDPAKLALLAGAGVNRLSLGVQSFDDDLLSFLGRIHTAREAEEAWDMARSAGFSNLNLDLIYAIPGQTLGAWRRTLKRALSLQPEHLSAYSLSIEPGTEFGRRAEAGSLKPVAEELDLSMYRAAQELLGEAGLKQYEISNFARPGLECRHNLVYWRNEPYLGLGPAATSYLSGVRRTNREDVGEYIRALAAGEDPTAAREVATLELGMAETVILGLRLTEGIAWERFYDRFGCDLRDVFADSIRRLTRAGLVEADVQGLRLTPRGLPVANRVFQEFLP